MFNVLKVYMERYYKRMEELVDESYLVEYILREMDVLVLLLKVVKEDGEGDVDMIEV